MLPIFLKQNTSKSANGSKMNYREKNFKKNLSNELRSLGFKGPMLPVTEFLDHLAPTLQKKTLKCVRLLKKITEKLEHSWNTP